MMRRIRTLRSFNNERGVVAVFIVMLLPIMIGFLGIVVDLAMLRYTKEDVTNVAISAAQAAVQLGFDKNRFRQTGERSFDHTKVDDAVADIVNEHNKNRKYKIIYDANQVKYGGETVTVPLHTEVHPVFLPFFNKDFATRRITGVSTCAIARKN